MGGACGRIERADEVDHEVVERFSRLTGRLIVLGPQEGRMHPITATQQPHHALMQRLEQELRAVAMDCTAMRHQTAAPSPTGRQLCTGGRPQQQVLTKGEPARTRHGHRVLASTSKVQTNHRQGLLCGHRIGVYHPTVSGIQERSAVRHQQVNPELPGNLRDQHVAQPPGAICALRNGLRREVLPLPVRPDSLDIPAARLVVVKSIWSRSRFGS